MTRTITLTSLIMKCLEYIVKHHLCTQVNHLRDPLQLEYCEGKSVQDTLVKLIHDVSQHLNKTNSQVRLLHVGFSSTINTVQSHIFMNKLLQINVNSRFVSWMHSDLLVRPQYAKLNNIKSNVTCTNTGIQQGCVLVPIMFAQNTNDCVSNYGSCLIMKYVDDTVVLSKISRNNSVIILLK